MTLRALKSIPESVHVAEDPTPYEAAAPTPSAGAVAEGARRLLLDAAANGTALALPQDMERELRRRVAAGDGLVAICAATGMRKADAVGHLWRLASLRNG